MSNLKFEILTWNPNKTDEQFDAVHCAMGLGRRGFRYLQYAETGEPGATVAVCTKVKISESKAQEIFDRMQAEGSSHED